MPLLKACHCCGLIHRLPATTAGEVAMCVRCGATIHRPADRALAANRTAAAATAAFVLFWPAVLLPIVEIERLGHHHHSSLLVGTFELILHGSWFVGIVVLLFSFIFPIVKIVLLLELSLLGILNRRHRSWTYRIVEHLGKWSMMDVMLLAFLVTLVKLGNLVQFHLGSAVVAFVLCVVASMVASLSFDPHLIWDEVEERRI